MCVPKKKKLLWSPSTNLSRWCKWVRQVGGQPIGGGGSPRPLAGFMHQGNTNIPLGGVGRSAHQMTSHPTIDFFYSCSCGSAYCGELRLALGARALVCSDMSLQVGEGVEGADGDWDSRRTTSCRDLLVMTDVSRGESGVNAVSPHSCSCFRYPLHVTLFVPVEHLESWHW